MKIAFSKYHGAGNDFIIIDNREGLFDVNVSLIRNLCHRQFGIGADGLMLLENEPQADFRMRYFNSDGNESTMCGNGGRCITMFAHSLGLIKDQACFIGIDGEHLAAINPDGIAKLKMKDVNRVDFDEEYYFLDTGSPHCVYFVENVDRVDVENRGKFLRNSFNIERGGVNVNFVQLTANGLKVRTFERGVEGETLACGTGSTAAAIAANIAFDTDNQPVVIEARGGELKVFFEKFNNNYFINIWLEGPAVHVFDGSIII